MTGEGFVADSCSQSFPPLGALAIAGRFSLLFPAVWPSVGKPSVLAASFVWY